jgi:hypothetical protein
MLETAAYPQDNCRKSQTYLVAVHILHKEFHPVSLRAFDNPRTSVNRFSRSRRKPGEIEGRAQSKTNGIKSISSSPNLPRKMPAVRSNSLTFKN